MSNTERLYLVATDSDGRFTIPVYNAPATVTVAISGSTWGGTMLKTRFLGRGMRLEFHHPSYRTPIVTSPIQEIVERVQSLVGPTLAHAGV